MKEGQNPDSASLMSVEDFDNDTGADTEVVSEGGATQPEFASKDIGNKATVEYFSNVEGGKKNQEKVMRRRTHATRKTLQVVLACALGVAVIFIVFFVALNLLNKRVGTRTHEELDATTIGSIEIKAYEEAYKTGKYYDGLLYLRDIIADLQDANADKDLIFKARLFRAEFMYDAGGKEQAFKLLDNLESTSGLTDEQKYLLYFTSAKLYERAGDTEKADQYKGRYTTIDNYHDGKLYEGMGSVENSNE